jgi:hypothetical protein
MQPGDIVDKDPDAKLDYGIKWRKWLDPDETIDTVEWTVPTGLTKESDQELHGTCVVWLSGGTAGTTYLVPCHIVTSKARADDRSLTIRVVDR